MNTTTTQRVYAVSPDQRIDRLERRAVISALWIFVLLNFIFRDLHEIMKAEVLADAMDGIYQGQEITEAMFLLGGVMIEVPSAMALMVWVLPLRANRWANVIVAPLFALTLIGLPGDLDDYFHVAVMLIALAVVVWKAWTWERSASSRSRAERNLTT
ncbi:MAG: DUF6326 family protein [Ornithinimicrobium sp.]